MRNSATAGCMAATKRVLVRSVLVFSIILIGTATAFAEKPLGCSVLGSWMGFDDDGILNWISMATGQSNSNGTYILEAPGFDVTLGNFFPHAVMITPMRGAWTRTGEYTFAVTMISIAVDSAGSTNYIAKLGALDTLSPNCNLMWIDGTLEIFLASDNPFEDAPLFAISLPGHWGHRIGVDLLDNQ